MWSWAVLMQTLGKIYSILTDKDKRAIYDEDGTVDEESSIFDQVYLHTSNGRFSMVVYTGIACV